MKRKIVVAILIAFLLMPSFISANEDVEKQTTSNTTDYNLYERTIIIFGKSRFIKDTFTTPPDCRKLSVSARVGPYFTGNAGIFIRSAGYSRDADNTIWGTGWYILGNFVWPALRFFEPSWFTPGLQYVEIETSPGFGVVTFWVNGSSAKTFHVGGSGPNNYTSIQEAINDAYPGDTIFIHKGIYKENTTIQDKPRLKIIGEDKNNTIIEGSIRVTQFYVPTDNVTIKGLTIRNGKYGINISTAHNTIEDCVICNSYIGIHLYEKLFVAVDEPDSNHISYCKISYNNVGIKIDYGNLNIISECNISHNVYGIKSLCYTNCIINYIYHNNFIDNEINAYDNGSNSWDNGYPSGGNYWSDFDEPSEGAYDNNSDGIVDSPYHIPGGNNVDRYPFIHILP